MQTADVPSSGPLSLISKFRRYMIVCIAVLSLPVSVYLTSGRIVIAEAPGEQSPVDHAGTPSPTPTCCMYTGTIGTSCQFQPGNGQYNFNVNALITNPCGEPQTYPANFYVEGSVDGTNFEFFVRTSIQNYTFQPGQNIFSETFLNQIVPEQYVYYRVRMQIYACGIYSIYSSVQTLCGPTPSPTPSASATATATPSSTPTVLPTATPAPSPTSTSTPTATPTATPTVTPTATPTATPLVVSVTVGTNPDGRSFSVDSVTYNSTQVFEWPIDSRHVLSTTTPQSGELDTRYVWNNWSDGGELSHSVIVTGTSTYTANFRRQYRLTTCCSHILYYNSVLPQTGYFDAGSTVHISAYSGSGFVVRGWYGNGNGGYTGPLSMAQVVMNGPISQNAIFGQSGFGVIQANFDGDNRSDISVFRPSEGNWYIQRSTAGFTAINFGLSTDKIVPADYDFDRKADVAVFRPTDGNWYSIRSSDGVLSVKTFGAAGDIPVPADYDGDGRVDLAVFRPSTSTWYVWNSSNLFTEFTTVQFGQEGDQPAIGDYNGDFKSDIAVFRPSTGVWYWISSANGGFVAEQFGAPGDKIVQGKYGNLNNATMIAVYRPSTGTWYIKWSENLIRSFQFGQPEDIPVPGHYNTSQQDIAVFRPSNGTWYIYNVLNGSYTFQQFGTAGDIPTLSAFGN